MTEFLQHLDYYLAASFKVYKRRLNTMFYQNAQGIYLLECDEASQRSGCSGGARHRCNLLGGNQDSRIGRSASAHSQPDHSKAVISNKHNQILRSQGADWLAKHNEEIEAPFEHRGFAKRARDHANALYRDERAP